MWRPGTAALSLSPPGCMWAATSESGPISQASPDLPRGDRQGDWRVRTGKANTNAQEIQGRRSTRILDKEQMTAEVLK